MKWKLLPAILATSTKIALVYFPLPTPGWEASPSRVYTQHSVHLQPFFIQPGEEYVSIKGLAQEHNTASLTRVRASTLNMKPQHLHIVLSGKSYIIGSLRKPQWQRQWECH